jgi:hypothetical protein
LEGLIALVGCDVFHRKVFHKASLHPSLKTTATKTKPECATDHKQKVLPMIVAVAANVSPNNAGLLRTTK